MIPPWAKKSHHEEIIQEISRSKIQTISRYILGSCSLLSTKSRSERENISALDPRHNVSEASRGVSRACGTRDDNAPATSRPLILHAALLAAAYVHLNFRRLLTFPRLHARVQQDGLALVQNDWRACPAVGSIENSFFFFFFLFFNGIECLLGWKFRYEVNDDFFKLFHIFGLDRYSFISIETVLLIDTAVLEFNF